MDTDLQLWPAYNHSRESRLIFLTVNTGFSLPVLAGVGGDLRSLPHFCLDTAENRGITNPRWREECESEIEKGF